MLVNIVRFCDSCNMVIATKERDLGQFESQDGHQACSRTMLDPFFAEQRAHHSAMESARTMARQRLRGGAHARSLSRRYAVLPNASPAVPSSLRGMADSTWRPRLGTPRRAM